MPLRGLSPRRAGPGGLERWARNAGARNITSPRIADKTPSSFAKHVVSSSAVALPSPSYSAPGASRHPLARENQPDSLLAGLISAMAAHRPSMASDSAQTGASPRSHTPYPSIPLPLSITVSLSPETEPQPQPHPETRTLLTFPTPGLPPHFAWGAYSGPNRRWRLDPHSFLMTSSNR